MFHGETEGEQREGKAGKENQFKCELHHRGIR